MSNISELAKVRSQFDEVLMNHIKSILEVDPQDAEFLNLAAISCLLLAVERENDIKQANDEPPERYTRETFLTALAEIGLEIDDQLMTAFEDILQKGFIEEGPEGAYSATMSAADMVHFVDTLFPGMPGMNLVAFMIQITEEVLTGRKEFEDAKSHFMQTLTMRSRKEELNLKHLKTGDPKTQEPEKAASQPVVTIASSEDLKKAYEQRAKLSQKLSELRHKAIVRFSRPTVITKNGLHTRAQIRELFPMADEPEELNEDKGEEIIAREAEIAAREAEIAAREAEIKALQDRIQKQAEEKSKEPAEKIQEKPPEPPPKEVAPQPEKEEPPAPPPPEAEITAPPPQPEPPPPKPEPLEKVTQVQAPQEPIAASPPQPLSPPPQAAPPPPSPSPVDERPPTKEVSIEEQIAAFQQELAMPCPLCGDGKVTSQTTEKGREYFACSSDQCRFISWAKPYHFSCPLCHNSFLTEFTGKDGALGLNCPRAACSFSQVGLHDPAVSVPTPSSPQTAVSAADTGEAPKKKKKLVRRVRKKK